MLRTLDMQVNAKKHKHGMEQQEKLLEAQQNVSKIKTSAQIDEFVPL